MAIAEVAARVGIFTKAAEAKPLTKEVPLIAQIRQFKPEEASDLATRYLHSRWFLLGKNVDDMMEGEARSFGITEIQGIVLSMLGHDPLLQDRVVKLYASEKFNPQIYKVLDLTGEDINSLAQRYKEARKLSVKGDFSGRIWTNKNGRELKPEEARIQGNIFELAIVLDKLGQGELVKTVDREIPDPNEIDWVKNRTSTGAELQ